MFEMILSIYWILFLCLFIAFVSGGDEKDMKFRGVFVLASVAVGLFWLTVFFCIKAVQGTGLFSSGRWISFAIFSFLSGFPFAFEAARRTFCIVKNRTLREEQFSSVKRMLV